MNIETLDFVPAVRLHFSFLEDEFGFRVAGEGMASVRYESDAVFVEVDLGMPYFEIGLAIGLRDCSRPDRTGYGIHRLIRLCEGKSRFQYTGLQALMKTDVDVAVCEIAKLLRSYGERALRGCVDVFDAMLEISISDMEQDRVDHIRLDAEAAFQKKEYRQAAEFYSSMEPHLTATEVKKMAYARKHLAQQQESKVK